MSRKSTRIIAITVLSLFMILQFQNCTQQGGTAASVDQEEILIDRVPEDGIVTTIDNVNLDTAVAFIESEVTLHEEVIDLDLQGVCAETQSGARLAWTIRDEDGRMVDRGFADCDSGQFEVTLSDVDSLDCEVAHEVQAGIGLGDKGVVQITRRCVDSEPAIAVANVDDGRQCFIESSENGCHRSCYSETGRLIAQIPSNQCE